MIFKPEKHILNILPATFDRAAELATKILRSEFHIDELCSMHTDPQTQKPHINKADLALFVAKEDVFMVDKIRHMGMLNARACTVRDYDVFKVYLNPLLLLEMCDRERESAELILKPASQWEDLLAVAPAGFNPNKVEPIRRHHNSLVYCQQYRTHFSENASITPTRKAPKNSTTATPSRASAIVPSDLSVEEKDVWLLAILLVHEADHLLNRLFSTYLIDKRTPEKLMRDTDQLKFNDIGHMMELKLYGWVIHHGFDDVLPAPFAVHEVLGATHTAPNMPKRVLTPSAQMRTLLANPSDLTIPITAEVLKATVTSDAYFQQSSKPIELGSRKSAFTTDDFSLDLPSVHKSGPLEGEYKNVFESWKD